MEFNKENYEEYALDYLEDTMSPQDRLQFESFLWRNPDIKVEFDDFQLIYLPEPNLNENFPGKERLIKPVAVTIPLHARNNRGAWKKWSVAAAILLLLGVTYFTISIDERAANNLVEVVPPSVPEDIQLDQHQTIDPIELSDNEVASVLNPQEKSDATKNTFSKDIIDQEKELSNISEETDTKENRNSKVDVAILDPIQTAEEKIFVAEPEEDVAINIERDIRPIRDVVQVSTLPQRQMAPNTLETGDRDLPMPILIIDEEPDEKFRLGKFLAKANLLPRSLGDIVGVGFKEKLVPESFQEIKETR